MLCGVTATLGSNPSATATAARPQWGRAVLLCLGDVLCCCVAVLPHGCFGRRRARSLGVPVGGGPPARSPHASLRLGVVDLEARPGPAAAHRHRDQAPPLPINFARNSPAACSNIECASLELQRFWGVSKNDHDKLRATFGQCGLCCRLRVLGSDSPAIPALVIPEAVGVLHYTKPAGGVSPACRALV